MRGCPPSQGSRGRCIIAFSSFWRCLRPVLHHQSQQCGVPLGWSSSATATNLLPLPSCEDAQMILGARSDNPQLSAHLNILNQTTSAKSLLPEKVALTGSRDSGPDIFGAMN